MSKVAWCWRCKMDVPMLEETEWREVVTPWLEQPSDHGDAAREAERHLGRRQAVLEAYVRITGFPETNPEAVMPHRLAQYGPPCVACGRPLRTPRATFCASCGRRVADAG